MTYAEAIGIITEAIEKLSCTYTNNDFRSGKMEGEIDGMVKMTAIMFGKTVDEVLADIQ